MCEKLLLNLFKTTRNNLIRFHSFVKRLTSDQCYQKARYNDGVRYLASAPSIYLNVESTALINTSIRETFLQHGISLSPDLILITLCESEINNYSEYLLIVCSLLFASTVLITFTSTDLTNKFPTAQ